MKVNGKDYPIYYGKMLQTTNQMYMYVCIYVCMYGCMYVCIYVCLSISIYLYIFIYMLSKNEDITYITQLWRFLKTIFMGINHQSIWVVYDFFAII